MAAWALVSTAVVSLNNHLNVLHVDEVNHLYWRSSSLRCGHREKPTMRPFAWRWTARAEGMIGMVGTLSKDFAKLLAVLPELRHHLDALHLDLKLIGADHVDAHDDEHETGQQTELQKIVRETHLGAGDGHGHPQTMPRIKRNTVSIRIANLLWLNTHVQEEA